MRSVRPMCTYVPVLGFSRVVNIAILKVLQYYWQYFFEYGLHIANTFRDLVLLPVLQYFFLLCIAIQMTILLISSAESTGNFFAQICARR